MKRYKPYYLNFPRLLVYSCVIIFHISCGTYQSRELEMALQDSGNNREELGKVINHYLNKEDKFKLKAARFLITNMMWKMSIDSASVSANNVYFDAFEEYLGKHGGDYGDQGIYYVADSIRALFPEVTAANVRYTFDLRNVTVDFLIRHIDSSFERWERCVWAKNISFDDFCRYILPYKVGHTYWEEAFDFFYNEYSPLVEQYKDSSIYAVARYIDNDIKLVY